MNLILPNICKMKNNLSKYFNLPLGGAFLIKLIGVLAGASLIIVQPSYSQVMDNPLKIPIEFIALGDTSGLSPTAELHVDIPLIAGAQANYTRTVNPPVIFDNGYGLFEEGKKYTVDVTGLNNTGYEVRFKPIPGYFISINNKKVDEFISYEFLNDPDNPDQFTLEVHKTQWAEVALAGQGSSIIPGKDKVMWYVSMGYLKNGNSAGHIVLAQDPDDPLIYSQGALYFDTFHSETSWGVEQPSGELFFLSSQAKAKVENITATSYELHFFAKKYNATTQVWEYDTTAYVIYKLEKPATYNGLKITRTAGADVKATTYTKTSTDNWVLEDWHHASPGVIRKITGTNTYDALYPNVDTKRYESITVENTAEGVKAQTVKTFQIFDWGEELVEILEGETPRTYKTEYAYYTESTDDFSYRKVKSKVNPNGSWLFYVYDDSAFWGIRGKVKEIYRPFGNTPLISAPTTTGTHVTIHENIDTEDYEGMGPKSIEEKIENKTVFKTRTIRSYEELYFDEARDDYTGLTRYSERTDYSDNEGNTTLTGTKTYGFDEFEDTEYNDFMVGMTTYVINPDGSKQAFVYYRGEYNQTTKVFTTESWRTGTEKDRMLITLNGYSTQVTDSVKVEQWEGQNIDPLAPGANPGIVDPIYMVPYVSTIEVVIRDDRALTARKQKYLYVGGVDIKKLIVETDLTYDAAGKLKNRSDSNGQIYSAEWINDLKDSQTDEQGIKTSYTYDGLGRVKTETKKGIAAAGGFPEQDDLVTTYTYSPDNLLTSISVGTTNPLVTTRVYDKGGRLVSETVPGPYTTLYDYSGANGEQVETVTLPNNSQRITTKYLDQRVQKITGDAQVNSFYTYEMYDMGFTSGTTFFLSEKVTVGVESGPRWTTTRRDWLNRDYEYYRPAFTGYSQTFNYYNSKGQFWKTDSNGIITLFEYNDRGEQVLSGLDLNTNDVLDKVSDDRIEEQDTVFDEDTGNIWLKITNTTYPTADVGTPKVTSKVWNRLNGFTANGVAAETRTYDINDNLTTTQTSVFRSEKKVVVVTDFPFSTNDQTSTSINGLLMKNEDAQGVTVDFGYDDKNRQTEVTDHFGTTSTTYDITTGEVEKVTDTADKETSFFYDFAGRLDYERNHLLKKKYFAYNNRDQVTNIWGEVPYPVEYGYDPNYGERTTVTTYRADPGGGESWNDADWPDSPGTGDTTTSNYQASTGLLTSKVDAANKTTSYQYNVRGQLTLTTLARTPTITITRNYFEAAGNFTGELKDIQYSDTTPDVSYEYNRLGQKKSVTENVTGTRTFVYRATDNQLDYVDFESGFYGTGKRLTYTYGPNGRNTGNWFGLSAASKDTEVTYGFNPATARLETVNSGTGAFTYGYLSNTNNVNSITRNSTGGGAYSQSLIYEPNRNLLQSIETTLGVSSIARFGYRYDDLGRRRDVVKTGSIFSRYGVGLMEHYEYTKSGSLFDRSELHKAWTDVGTDPDVAGTVLPGRTFVYDYDHIGNRTSAQIDSQSATVYTPNNLNQYISRSATGMIGISGLANSAGSVLVEGTLASRVSDYFYAEMAVSNGVDPAPQSVEILAGQADLGPLSEDIYNRETRTSFVPPSSESYNHDFDGNLSNDARWDYTYDAENRLVQMQTKAAAVANGILNEKLVFRYDELHRRVEKVYYSGPSLTLQYTKRFLYNGWNLIAEMNVAGTIERTYTWGLDISGTVQEAGGVRGLLMVTDGSIEYLSAYDSLGNLHALVNAQNGVVDAVYEYSPFGELLRSSGTYAKTNSFGLSTKYTDRESDLVYYGRRYYNADTGRFINRDPIEQEGGLNLYAFVSNNAINLWDYLGMRRAFDVRFGGRDHLTASSPGYKTSLGATDTIADAIEVEANLAKQADPSKNFKENTVFETKEDPDGTEKIEVSTDDTEESKKSSTTTNNNSTIQPSTSNQATEVKTQLEKRSESASDRGDGAVDGEESGFASGAADIVQGVIGVVGLIPAVGNIADGVNATISAGRGNYVDASFDGASAVPGAGQVVGATVIGRRIISGGGKLWDAAKGLFKSKAAKNVGRIDDTASAATTVGRRGQEASFPNPKAPVPRNTPGNVNGRDFSGHAFDRLQERGLLPSVIENTIQNGTRSAGNTAGSSRFYDAVNDVTAIIDDATGKVITAY